jgi:serine/threonine protein kinase
MTTTSEHTGTTRYLAPELVASEESVPPTLASDVYALGCLGLEVRLYGVQLSLTYG